MADPFTGEIRAFAFDYPPQDWAFCNGQTMLAQQNPALYAVIGNRMAAHPPRTSNCPICWARRPCAKAPASA